MGSNSAEVGASRDGGWPSKQSGATPSAFESALPESYLDAGACMELLGDLFPLTCSMLYFQLESFLRQTVEAGDSDVRDIPRRLLADNRDPQRRPWESPLDQFLPICADLTFDFDVRTQASVITLKRVDPILSSTTSTQPIRGRVTLQVFLRGADLTRVVRVPLQALMLDWGDVTRGYQEYIHSVTFRDDVGRILARHHYAGATAQNWLSRMQTHEREVLAGANRQFQAAWRNYTGASTPKLSAELVGLCQSEAAALEWEEAAVATYMASNCSLNLVPGGLLGMDFLHRAGALPSARASFEERDRALEVWASQLASAPRTPEVPNVARVPTLLGPWLDDALALSLVDSLQGLPLTPAQTMEARRLADNGKSINEIAALIGARNPDLVRQLLELDMPPLIGPEPAELRRP